MTQEISYGVILIVSIAIVTVLVTAICIFSHAMLKHNRQLKKQDYPDCPEIIFSKFVLWRTSFIWWTILTYMLTLIPLFTSIATIYFSTDLIHTNDGKTTALLLIMSFTSAFLPLVTSKVQPKMHADGFYKGIVLLEQGIIEHKECFIDTKALIKISFEAEKYTNPTLKLEE